MAPRIHTNSTPERSRRRCILKDGEDFPSQSFLCQTWSSVLYIPSPPPLSLAPQRGGCLLTSLICSTVVESGSVQESALASPEKAPRKPRGRSFTCSCCAQVSARSHCYLPPIFLPLDNDCQRYPPSSCLSSTLSRLTTCSSRSRYSKRSSTRLGTIARPFAIWHSRVPHSSPVLATISSVA